RRHRPRIGHIHRPAHGCHFPARYPPDSPTLIPDTLEPPDPFPLPLGLKISPAVEAAFAAPAPLCSFLARTIPRTSSSRSITKDMLGGRSEGSTSTHCITSSLCRPGIRSFS